MASESLGLLRGCRAISSYMHGDERHWREVPALAEQGWPVFKLNGRWSARADSLAREIAAREERAKREADTTANARKAESAQQTEA
jgi:hypothetical protein